jgi:hypothetical protein
LAASVTNEGNDEAALGTNDDAIVNAELCDFDDSMPDMKMEGDIKLLSTRHSI